MLVMKQKKYLQGTIKRHPDGFGFFIPEQKEHPDVYVPRHSMNGVMTNDKVMIEVEAEKGGERFRGEIIRILSRGTKQIVGRFTPINDKYAIIKDEGKGWGEDLKIPVSESMNAKDGELVAAEIVKYPEEGKEFLGRVCEVIGNALDPMNDIRRVVFSNNIPQEFSPETLAEAAKFGPNPTEVDFKNRKDLRNKNLITIDGSTAKDFDDAVLVETTNKGFLLYVAIADVSHYVQSGSSIDKEAYERGTSVYFPNFVIPMLPEQLSNGLCSLNPHVPRLCLVAEMHFDFTGEMMSSSFYEAVMESKARVTYGEAQEVLDLVPSQKFKHVEDVIHRCSDLAKLLMAKRFKEGSLDLEIPETELQIDGSGMPIDIQRSERLFSHKLIEELMLAANVAVAKFLGSREIPALYRIHEPPNPLSLSLLERFLETFGSKTKLTDGKLQKRLTKALHEFAGKPEAQILNILTLRSMSQAKYDVTNLGHFGLGFEYYTHFTSPIRRYPDLIVHRLVKNQVVKNSHYRLIPEDDLASAGTWLSSCEQRSVKAERQIHAIKKARFMEKHVGQEFDGIISSVAKFGVFVLLREFDIDGLIRAESLSKEKLEFDEERLSLYAKRSGLVYKIGDQMRVKVTIADVELGQINFELVKQVKTDEEVLADKANLDLVFKNKSNRRDNFASKKEKFGRSNSQSKADRKENFNGDKKSKKAHRKGPSKNASAKDPRKNLDKDSSKNVSKDAGKSFYKKKDHKKSREQIFDAKENPRKEKFEEKESYAPKGKSSSKVARGMDRLRQSLGVAPKKIGFVSKTESKGPKRK